MENFDLSYDKTFIHENLCCGNNLVRETRDLKRDRRLFGCFLRCRQLTTAILLARRKKRRIAGAATTTAAAKTIINGVCLF